MKQSLIRIQVFAWCAIAANVLGDETASNAELRPYKLGPLVIDDFRGQVSEGATRGAYTATRIVYEFKYRVTSRNGRVVARLSSFDAHAAFLPRESWWESGQNLELLDHEQGHFDIAEINARKLKLSMAKQLASGRPMAAAAGSARAASRALAEKIGEAIQLVEKRGVEENQEYDRRTRHGLETASQHEQRRIHKLTLNRLSEEIAGL